MTCLSSRDLQPRGINLMGDTTCLCQLSSLSNISILRGCLKPPTRGMFEATTFCNWVDQRKHRCQCTVPPADQPYQCCLQKTPPGRSFWKPMSRFHDPQAPPKPGHANQWREFEDVSGCELFQPGDFRRHSHDRQTGLHTITQNQWSNKCTNV